MVAWQDRLTQHMCILGTWRGGLNVDIWIDGQCAYWFDAENPKTAFYFTDELIVPEGVGCLPCHGWKAILEMAEGAGCGRQVKVSVLNEQDGCPYCKAIRRTRSQS